MERTLHRQLKERYGSEAGGRNEVVVGGFRIDAIDPDGRLIEVQSGPLSLLKGKLGRLLPTREIRVVKPIVVTRRVVRVDRRTGAELGARRSQFRGSLLDLFEELVGLARIFPHPNLQIDLLAVDIDEVRVARRRKPGFEVIDRLLREVVQTISLREGDDLWSLLPAELPDRFTTDDLVTRLDRPVAFAQRVAYCLLHCGSSEVVAKEGRRRVFARKAVEALA